MTMKVYYVWFFLFGFMLLQHQAYAMPLVETKVQLTKQLCHLGFIRGIVPLSDGRVASWSNDQKVCVWNRQDGRLVQMFQVEDTEKEITKITLLGNDRLLVTAEDCIQILDLQKGVFTRLKLGANTTPTAMVLSNGKILSWSDDSFSEDGEIRVWRPDGRLQTVYQKHQQAVQGVTERSNGTVLSWSEDSIHIWKQNGRTQSVFQEHKKPVQGAIELSNGDILSWSKDTVCRWSQDGKGSTFYKEHQNDIAGAFELSNGNIVSWSPSQIRIWNLEGVTKSILQQDKQYFQEVIEVPDNRLLSVGGIGGELTIWEIDQDNDKIGDLTEKYVYKTNPTKSDSDEDGCSDYDEITRLKTDPLVFNDWQSQSVNTEAESKESSQQEQVGGVIGGPSGGVLGGAIVNGCVGGVLGGVVPTKDYISYASSTMFTPSLWKNYTKIHPQKNKFPILTVRDKFYFWPEDSKIFDLQTAIEIQVEGGVSGFLQEDNEVFFWGEILSIWDIAVQRELTNTKPLFPQRYHAHPLSSNRLLRCPVVNMVRILKGSKVSHSCMVISQVTGKIRKRLKADYPAAKRLKDLPNDRILFDWGYEEDDKVLNLWDIQSNSVFHLRGHKERINGTTVVSEDRLLSFSNDGTIRLWNLQNGTTIRTFREQAQDYPWLYEDELENTNLSFARDLIHKAKWLDSAGVLVVFKDGRRFFYDLDPRGVGAEHQLKPDQSIDEFWERPPFVGAKMIAAERFLGWTNDNKIRVWDIATGRLLSKFDGHAGERGDLESSGLLLLPNDKILSTAWHRMHIWDSNTGREYVTMEHQHKGPVYRTDLLSNGRLMSFSWDGALRLWDIDNGDEVAVLQNQSKFLELSEDRIVTYFDKSDEYPNLYVRSANDGTILFSLQGHNKRVLGVESLSNERILSWSKDNTLRVWDASSGKALGVLPKEDELVEVRVLSDGRILSHYASGVISIWDGFSEKSQVTINGDPGLVITAIHEGWILTSGNGALQYWSIDTGLLLATVLFTATGESAVVSPNGWFDSSPDFAGLHFVANQRHVISLSQLRDRFYQPFLLERLIGERNEPLPNVLIDNNQILLPPKVTTIIDENSATLNIEVENRKGGIGKLEIKLNGTQIVGVQGRGHDLRGDVASGTIAVNLSNEPKLKSGEENLVEVTVFNQNNTIASRTSIATFVAPGIKDDVGPNFYALVIGTSDYKGNDLDLRFASKDAKDFAKALKLGANKALFPNATIKILSNEKGHTPPTKENIISAFELLKSTRPNDVVVVFLAGHGVQGTKAEEGYLYVTQDGSSFADIKDPKKQKQVTISSKELHQYLKGIPANKQVMILDTCASGAVANDLVTKRDLSADQIRAIDKLQRSSGLHVLMGSAGNAVSYEASQFGQGLLTYSLLEGMKLGSGLTPGSMIEVQKLFSYAQSRVVGLAKEIGGVQQPRSASPRGSSFMIGQLDKDTQERIPLQSAKPRFVRGQFRAKNRPRDVLGVNEKIKSALVAMMDDGQVVFSDVASAPNSCVLYGIYEQTQDGFSVGVRLRYGTEQLFKREVDNVAIDYEWKNLLTEVVAHCPVQ